MHRTYLIAFFGLFLPNSSTIMAVILYCTTIVSSFNQMNPISCSYPYQMLRDKMNHFRQYLRTLV